MRFLTACAVVASMVAGIVSGQELQPAMLEVEGCAALPGGCPQSSYIPVEYTSSSFATPTTVGDSSVPVNFVPATFVTGSGPHTFTSQPFTTSGSVDAQWLTLDWHSREYRRAARRALLRHCPCQWNNHHYVEPEYKHETVSVALASPCGCSGQGFVPQYSVTTLGTDNSKPWSPPSNYQADSTTLGTVVSSARPTWYGAHHRHHYVPSTYAAAQQATQQAIAQTLATTNVVSTTPVATTQSVG